jgi:uncharacterized protein YbaR (Trm112 family)
LSISAQRANQIAAALSAARARSWRLILFGFVTAYCDNPRCAAREIEIHVKEQHNEPVAPDLCCPACSGPLALHHIETREERHAAGEAEARSNVAAQLYSRRHPGEGIPLGTFLNVSLESLIARVLTDEGRA